MEAIQAEFLWSAAVRRIVEERGPSPSGVMKKELQESCTHTAGARRKEAVPGGGAKMLLAATRKMLESEMGEARMVHLGTF